MPNAVHARGIRDEYRESERRTESAGRSREVSSGTLRRVLLVAAAIGLASCVAPQANAPKVDELSDTSDQAIASCAQRMKTSNSSTSMLAVRRLLRVRTDDEAAPILCRKIRRGLVEGRLDYSDLSWDDGSRPMSTRLVKVLREP